MKVLVACEESQEVCKAFRAKGHEAYSCDIQECSGGHPEWHIKSDVVRLLNGHCIFHTQDGSIHLIYNKWDLIIAHPPCTYLSKAGARWMFRNINGEKYINVERYNKMKDGRSFFFQMLNADCDKIAVENPVPLKICELPKPTQIIQPYQFGHPYSKKTLLWLKNLPSLKSTSIIETFTPYLPSNTGGFARGKKGSKGVVRTAKKYARTFPGIAKAMADQWGDKK